MIRIGLLGASRIARGAIIEPVACNDSFEVVAVAARSPSRAREYADTHRIPIVEPDYAALIANPAIDLVYVGLPPSEHREWTVAALQAGKHVLCEKPFAMNALEAESMVVAASETGKTLIEAFHYRFHPLFARIMEVLSAGSIGPVQHIDCRFNVPIAYEPAELRFNRHLGGGAMMDLGCYPAHWARTIAGEEPRVVSARADWHDSGVDTAMEAQLEFPSGITATLSCSMAEDLPDGLDTVLTVTGERGTLEVNNPLVPHIGHELTVKTELGLSSETADKKSTYHYQLLHVADVLENDAKQLTGGADAVENMRVLDAVYSAAASCRGPG
ncbi:MAG: Gfo/Idh/MocA family oxidoreductase [Pseudomonadota bacterium]